MTPGHYRNYRAMTASANAAANAETAAALGETAASASDAYPIDAYPKWLQAVIDEAAAAQIAELQAQLAAVASALIVASILVR